MGWRHLSDAIMRSLNRDEVRKHSTCRTTCIYVPASFLVVKTDRSTKKTSNLYADRSISTARTRSECARSLDPENPEIKLVGVVARVYNIHVHQGGRTRSSAHNYGGPIGRAMCRLPCDDVHATIDDVDATIDDVDVTIDDVDVTIANVDVMMRFSM